MKTVYFVKVEVEGTIPFFRGIWPTLEATQKWVADYERETKRTCRGKKILVTLECMHVMCSDVTF